MSKAAGSDQTQEQIRQKNKNQEQSRPVGKRPSMYVVVLHNDPITPRQFVVLVLKKFFSKGESDANRIMLLAHNFGIGVVASFPHDIAETKANQVNQYARENGYPLNFTVERED